MKIYYPIKPIAVNQKFGENANAFYAQAGLKGHSGIDFRAYHGQAVYATHDGVCMPQVDDHGGNGVVIISDVQPDKTQWKTIYWHLILDNAVVQTGDKVKAGDLIGYADNTGQSTGDHLHFGLCFFPQDNSNGYNGFVDPQPYFNGLYAEDIKNPPQPVPKYVFTATLRLGSWNNDVKQLQTLLNKLQGSALIVDGIFGVKTQLAVKSFQTAHNLVADGIVGKLTNAVLNSII